MLHGMGARQMVAVEQLADQYDFMRREGGVDIRQVIEFRKGIFFDQKEGIVLHSTSSKRWYVYFSDTITVLPKEGADSDLFSPVLINNTHYLAYHSHGEVLYIAENGMVIRPQGVEKERHTWRALLRRVFTAKKK